MNIISSQEVIDKLRAKHNVGLKEVEQCFENRCGLYLEDDREEHRTDPATLWFISETNKGRKLKVVFIFLEGNVVLKTAFEPSQAAIHLYETDGK